uniref:IS116/IS110/IS902 transposase n=1 Tax=Rhizobium meliloti TaxID=382 RepID=I2E1P6_RHIML|nr:IS116/IS110/IS902 transposase [Sinorhizobium meliloti]
MSWTEPIDLAGHFVVAGQRRKDVEAWVDGGDVAELLDRFAQIQEKARLPTGRSFPIVRIQEAELDGFWIHRVPEAYGIESYVVDAAAIATSRRRPRAKTDKIDGEALVRELLAFNRGVVVYAQLSKRRAHSTKIGGASAGRNG